MKFWINSWTHTHTHTVIALTCCISKTWMSHLRRAEPLRDNTDAVPAVFICVVSVPCYCVVVTFTDSTLWLSFLCCSRLCWYCPDTQVQNTAASRCSNSCYSQNIRPIGACFNCICLFTLSSILNVSKLNQTSCFILWSHWCQTAKLILYLCMCVSLYADLCVCAPLYP